MKNNRDKYHEINKKEMENIHAGVIINNSRIIQWIVQLVAPGNIV